MELDSNEIMSTSAICCVCGKTSCVYCPRCRQVGYCSHDHRLLHWDAHDKECVAVNPVKIGRIGDGAMKQRTLITRNEFKSGTVVFFDAPLIRGPDDNLLSPDADSIHCLMECAIFHGKSELVFHSVKPARFILILRCLLTKETNPKTWNKILALETNPMSKQLEKLLEGGKPITDRQLKRQHTLEMEVLKEVMDHLRHFQLQKRFSRHLVSRVIQILNWNALPTEMGLRKYLIHASSYIM
ncbi:unnamed protein product [Orchesella dallaii]|uniref:MYND-type domain-containing protein n=1 Tax=Orchesella dallaii TaxID=48710 RepID=A0ABP1RCJ3_9HEXA